jgi:hypothetical protein
MRCGRPIELSEVRPATGRSSVPAVADTAGRSGDAGDAFANEEIVLGDHQPQWTRP